MFVFNMLQSLFVCRLLLTGGTVIPVSLIAVVPTVLEKSVFYGYLAVASVSLGLPTQFVHCCLAATRAFMPASLIVIPYTILEISKFLGQLPVDDDDDEKCQLNAGKASLRSELPVPRALTLSFWLSASSSLISPHQDCHCPNLLLVEFACPFIDRTTIVTQATPFAELRRVWLAPDVNILWGALTPT